MEESFECGADYGVVAKQAKRLITTGKQKKKKGGVCQERRSPKENSDVHTIAAQDLHNVSHLRIVCARARILCPLLSFLLVVVRLQDPQHAGGDVKIARVRSCACACCAVAPRTTTLTSCVALKSFDATRPKFLCQKAGTRFSFGSSRCNSSSYTCSHWEGEGSACVYLSVCVCVCSYACMPVCLCLCERRVQ